MQALRALAPFSQRSTVSLAQPILYNVSWSVDSHHNVSCAAPEDAGS